MTMYYIKTPFDATAQYVARRDFTAFGRRFHAGDQIPQIRTDLLKRWYNTLLIAKLDEVPPIETVSATDNAAGNGATVMQLRDQLKALGLPIYGDKRTLSDRLRKHNSAVVG